MIACASCLYGQTDVSTAALTGVVTDPSGAAIPNASITAVSMEKGTVREIRGDEIGNYRVPLLDPGTYQVRGAAAGFTPRVFDGIVLTVGDDFVLNAQLKLPAIAQESPVTAT